MSKNPLRTVTERQMFRKRILLRNRRFNVFQIMERSKKHPGSKR